jgi:hypothetical protein
MRLYAVLAACLASSFAASQDAPARRAESVAQRYFGSDWTEVDPADVLTPPAPRSEAIDWEGPVQEEHSKVAHMSITRAAYLYYSSRYEGGELSRYIGASDGRKPASDTPDNVVAGAFDEDVPHKDPWNQLIPELRHFWDCRGGPFKGLFGYDSSVNRAQKYFTGGYDLKGAYDRGWNSKEVQGHGIVWHYRNGDKALAYWYLGHAAHLLEDATVPAHVLLYPHPLKNADAYETFMATHYADWESRIPEGEVDSFDTLYDLFYRTADVTNDFDAGSGAGPLGRDGKKDRGARRKGGFTEAELREEGDVLMPLAYRRVASMYLYFYRQIDRIPPRVGLVYPRSGDAGAPDLTADSSVTLRARAVDDVSGVDRTGYRFEYAVWTGSAWSPWRAVSTAASASSLDFPVETGRRYAVRVWAADAAGNRAVSATGYLSAAPAVASVR